MNHNITQILASSKTIKITNVPQIKVKLKAIKSKFAKYDIKLSINDDKAYFDAEIIYQSILNKESFEENYERLKVELFDIWDKFDYKERKKCIDDEMQKVKANTNFFIYDDKIIRIAFFDSLLNSLYENEMIIFDLPQYFKLEKKFSDRMIDVNIYQSLPYKAGFSSSLYLLEDSEGYVIFNQYTKSLYHIHENGKCDKYQFDRFKDPSHFTDDVLSAIASAIISNDERAMIAEIIKSGLCSKYIENKLTRYQRKLLKRGS